MTTKNRNLAKGMLPALLLSAALTVPATAHADKGKHQEKAQQHAQQAQKQANKAQKQANKAQRQAQQARVAPKRVVVAPQRVVVGPQRVVVPQQRVVVRQPVGLCHRVAVPIEAEPAEVVEGLLGGPRLVPPHVDVFDPQQHPAAPAAGAQPGEQVCPGVADVLGASGRRG